MAAAFTMPEDVLLAETHEYVRMTDDDRARVGITEFAAAQLGDIVFVELPEIGQSFEKGESFGSIESVKAQSDLYMPVTGEIIAINPQLGEEPEMVNDDAFNGGWMLEIAVAKPEELDTLLSPSAYTKFVEEAGG